MVVAGADPETVPRAAALTASPTDQTRAFADGERGIALDSAGAAELRSAAWPSSGGSMPSAFHEMILELVRSEPELLRAWAPAWVRDAWREGAEVTVADSQFVEHAPIERRADLVLRLDGLSIVVEAQLRRDEAKLPAWPVYQSLLRARSGHPVIVVVVTTRRSVEAWAQQGIEMAPGQRWSPVVIGPASIPASPTRAQVARNPALGALALRAHRERPEDESLRAARDVLAGLDDATASGLADDAARLYLDAILDAAPDGVRRALEDEMEQRNHEYKSDFARKYVAQGRAEGRAAAIAAIAAARGIALTPAQRDFITACTDIALLDTWLMRAATAVRADEVFG